LTREESLFGPATDDLHVVDELLKKTAARDPPEVGRPMVDLLEAGGKRIRPALVLLAAMCGSYARERTIPAAVAVEVTHAATLVHDDVIDRSPTRRGRPTVAASLGDEPAIVIGDYYFARAYHHAASTGVAEAVDVLARAVMEICAGEVHQQAIRYRYSTGIDEYMRRIASKTATLLAASCDIGALLGGLTGDKRDALRDYGASLGLAFQIADDVLDYTATEGEVGKPIGHDVLEGFATLPLMLSGVRLEDGRRLTDSEARDVVATVRAGDGAQRALAQAHHHAENARAKLRVLDPSDATSALASLTDYVVTRKL